MIMMITLHRREDQSTHKPNAIIDPNGNGIELREQGLLNPVTGMGRMALQNG